MFLKEKIKEKKEIEKAMENVEVEQTKAIIKASEKGEDLPEFSDMETLAMIDDELEEKKYGKTKGKLDLFAKEHLVDWLIIFISIITFASSWFIPKAEIGWIFSFVMLLTLGIRQPIARTSTITFVGLYYIGILSSHYFLRVDQVLYSFFFVNKILKWGFIFGGIITFVTFVFGVVAGVRDFKPKYMGIMSIILVASALVVSALDLTFTGLEWYYYPNVPALQLFLIESSGFFVVLMFVWSFWYLSAMAIRRIYIGKKEYRTLIEGEMREEL